MPLTRRQQRALDGIGRRDVVVVLSPANARLIAAAPELAEMVAELVELFVPQDAEDRAVRVRAQALIARIEGRE